ncbi:hypothetical protein Trydic_g19238 [Trypoxylus dichotomus]
MSVEPEVSYRKRLDDLRNETELMDCLEAVRGTLLSVNFEKEYERIENFECRDEDVWVTSFPKSGTTWTQEMVWLLGNNLNYDGAKEGLDKRYTFMEGTALITGYIQDKPFELTIPDPVDTLNGISGRRFIKSHLPWHLLPKQIRDGTRKPKIIHVVRNPKDVCVSYYHYTKIFSILHSSLEDYFKKFISDKFLYSPYWPAVFGYWKKRDLPNLLILRYEEMIKDMPSVIKKTAEFLGVFVAEEDMTKLLEHLSFKQMKNNKAINYEQVAGMFLQQGALNGQLNLIRNGKIGSYKEELTEDMINLLEVWCQMNNEDTGLKFDV